MAIKNITVGQFSAEAHTLPGVVLSGDLVRVDCDEAGAFVLIEEPEYQALRDAMAALIAVSTSPEIPDVIKDAISAHLKKMEGAE